MAPTNKLPSTTLAGVAVVNTPLVQAAQAYARKYLDDMSFNHSMRSWLFSVLASQKMQAKGIMPPIDLEAQAVSTILHDLGWDQTGTLVSNDKRFEVDGAIAAREWLLEQEKIGNVSDHWDENRLQLVWDAIALHSTPSIAAFKQPVVGAVTAGIAADFLGPKSDPTGTLTMEEFDAVVRQYPRHSLAEGIREIMCNFCRTKPATTFDNFQMEYGRRYVEGYTAERALAFDLIENSLP